MNTEKVHSPFTQAGEAWHGSNGGGHWLAVSQVSLHTSSLHASPGSQHVPAQQIWLSPQGAPQGNTHACASQTWPAAQQKPSQQTLLVLQSALSSKVEKTHLFARHAAGA